MHSYYIYIYIYHRGIQSIYKRRVLSIRYSKTTYYIYIFIYIHISTQLYAHTHTSYKHCPLQAGLASTDYPEQLFIALEPEAGSIYVRRLRLYQVRGVSGGVSVGVSVGVQRCSETQVDTSCNRSYVVVVKVAVTMMSLNK